MVQDSTDRDAVVRRWIASDEAQRRKWLRDHRFQSWLVIPLFAVLAVFFAWAAISEGVAADWDPSAIVRVARSVGPLWRHLLITVGICAVMLLFGVLTTRANRRNRPPSPDELAQHNR